MFDFLSSQGGKFSVIPLFLNLGSGLALLGIVSIQIDIVILFYCFIYSTMCSCAFHPAIRRSFQGSMKFTISHFFCRPQFFVTLWFSMYFRRSIFTGRKNICWLMILKVNLMISRYVEVALSCFFFQLDDKV